MGWGGAGRQRGDVVMSGRFEDDSMPILPTHQENQSDPRQLHPSSRFGRRRPRSRSGVEKTARLITKPRPAAARPFSARRRNYRRLPGPAAAAGDLCLHAGRVACAGVLARPREAVDEQLDEQLDELWAGRNVRGRGRGRSGAPRLVPLNLALAGPSRAILEWRSDRKRTTRCAPACQNRRPRRRQRPPPHTRQAHTVVQPARDIADRPNFPPILCFVPFEPHDLRRTDGNRRRKAATVTTRRVARRPRLPLEARQGR